MRIEPDPFVNSDRLFGTEDGIEGNISGIDRWRGILYKLEQGIDMLQSTVVITRSKIAF